jgi:hypothetical protein
VSGAQQNHQERKSELFLIAMSFRVITACGFMIDARVSME